MKKKTPKSYHHGNLRDALVAAGRDILEAEGASALTLRACARKAGVSHAAPLHHFASADELLAEIAATGFEDFHVALEKSASNKTTPRTRLNAMGIAYIKFAQQRPALYKLMFGGEAPPKSEHLKSAMGAAWTQLVDAVSAVSGENEKEAKAVLIWSVVHGYAMLSINHRLPTKIDASVILGFLEEFP
jgi:AcrR family transcriptional regulator